MGGYEMASAIPSMPAMNHKAVIMSAVVFCTCIYLKCPLWLTAFVSVLGFMAYRDPHAGRDKSRHEFIEKLQVWAGTVVGRQAGDYELPKVAMKHTVEADKSENACGDKALDEPMS